MSKVFIANVCTDRDADDEEAEEAGAAPVCNKDEEVVVESCIPEGERRPELEQ